MIDVGIFFSQNKSKQQTRILLLVQVFLSHVQLALELLFWNFHCSYLRHSARRPALT